MRRTGSLNEKAKVNISPFAFQAFGLFFSDQWSCTAEWFLTEELVKIMPSRITMSSSVPTMPSGPAERNSKLLADISVLPGDRSARAAKPLSYFMLRSQ